MLNDKEPADRDVSLPRTQLKRNNNLRLSLEILAAMLSIARSSDHRQSILCRFSQLHSVQISAGWFKAKLPPPPLLGSCRGGGRQWREGVGGGTSAPQALLASRQGFMGC